jgi:DNA-binding beta-propeller fold protein YncE
VSFGEAEKKGPHRLLDEPRALALAGDRIYIADRDAHRVVVLDHFGKVIQSWGAKGDQYGQFKYPSGIAVDDDGTVYVVDKDNDRVQVFDAKGVFFRSFGTGGPVGEHECCWVREVKDVSGRNKLYWKGKESDDPMTEMEIAGFKEGLAYAEAGKKAEAVQCSKSS